MTSLPPHTHTHGRYRLANACRTTRRGVRDVSRPASRARRCLSQSRASRCLERRASLPLSSALLSRASVSFFSFYNKTIFKPYYIKCCKNYKIICSFYQQEKKLSKCNKIFLYLKTKFLTIVS